MTSPTIATDDVETSSARQSGIYAKGLRRTFDSFVAVSDLDLAVPPGQVTALVGPNGAGKTTLLLMLASLLKPDSGEMRVAGHDPTTEASAVRAKTGWSPDVFGVYDNLTLREYVRFFASAYRLDKSGITTRVEELLEMVRLTEFADRQVHVLSRGQKQRLGLTRALVHKPSVLMLDEPASGLDPRSRVELRDMLRRYAVEGAAVLVSSHILSDLEEVADRVAFIDGGRTVGQHDMSGLEATTARKWRIQSLDQTHLVAALDELSQEYDAPRSAGVDVQISSDEAAADLISQLVDRGVRITAIGPLGGALEATYMQLTEGQQ